jgi:hypothetical protein
VSRMTSPKFLSAGLIVTVVFLERLVSVVKRVRSKSLKCDLEVQK